MVPAGEGPLRAGGQSVSGIQRSDSDGRCCHLRGGAAQPALPQLFARPLQREAGEGRARFSQDVCRMHAGRMKRRSSFDVPLPEPSGGAAPSAPRSRQPAMPSDDSPDILPAVRRWWSDLAASEGSFAATRALLKNLWEFVRDSTPSRLKQRYGDADYDWDHRVNTTSAAVGWRDRLLGVFHSPYQPTEPAVFHEMLAALQTTARVDFRELTFIDLGSGKGRTLLMASDYPFRRILGVELLPELNEIAVENIARYTSERQKCFAIESHAGDARAFEFPLEPTVLYLFNPFPEHVLRELLSSLKRSLQDAPRPLWVIYHNLVHEAIFDEQQWLRRKHRTHQFAVYEAE